jgi:outer membrane murein-binding lipoprotein Lpp
MSKENENLRKDCEINKKNSEKQRNEYKELNENLKKIKENSETEMKKWEERYYVLEKKLENEKNTLMETNKELLYKLSIGGRVGRTGSVIEHSQTLAFKEEEENTDGDSTANNAKINLLSNEISALNTQIYELNAKLRNFEKSKNEIDLLGKENSKLKSDFKEMKEMYENQIQELQNKALYIANELQTSRRRTTTVNKLSSKGELTFSPKQLQMLAELEGTISRLGGEHKFLTEKTEILNKEIDNLRLLRDNDVKFLREEVRAAEEQAINAKVGLATLAFEKDSELIKYKNLCKKLKIRLTANMGNNGTTTNVKMPVNKSTPTTKK